VFCENATCVRVFADAADRPGREQPIASAWHTARYGFSPTVRLAATDSLPRYFPAFMGVCRGAARGGFIPIGQCCGTPRITRSAMVGDVVQALVPRAKITYTGEAGNDPRNYRSVRQAQRCSPISCGIQLERPHGRNCIAACCNTVSGKAGFLRATAVRKRYKREWRC